MSFDLSQVMQQAMSVKDKQDNQGSNGGNNLKLIYPQAGDLKVKLLFNPKSSVVTRLIGRHNVNGTKVPCLGEYALECPICKTLTSIESAKGIDLWKFKKQARGLAFAQYIDSNYSWDKPENKPAEGEIVLLMFPWTVYQAINRMIAEAGQMAGQIVAMNEGKVVKISRWVENNQTKYAAGIDTWAQPFKSCGSDQEFEEMLNGLDSLNDKIMPIACTDDILKQAKELSEQLTRDYLSGSVVNPAPVNTTVATAPNTYVPNVNVTEQNIQQVQYNTGATGTQYATSTFTPSAPTQSATSSFAPTAPTASANPAGSPECFGQRNSGSVNPNTCLLCPHELLCQQNSR